MASSARSFNDVYFPGYGVANRLAPDGGYAWGGPVGNRVTGLQYGAAPAQSPQLPQNDLPHWLTDITARGLAGDWKPDAHVTPAVQTPGYRDFTLNPDPAPAPAPAPDPRAAVPSLGSQPTAGWSDSSGGGGGDGSSGDSGASAGTGAQGDASSDSGASAGSDSGSAGGSASGDGSGGGSASGDGSGWARGGVVTRNRLVGPDPAGPDDGYAALNAGEGVLTAKAMKYYGPAFLARLNRLAVPKGASR